MAEMVINYSSGEPSLASKSQERLRQTSAKSGREQAGSGFLFFRGNLEKVHWAAVLSRLHITTLNPVEEEETIAKL